jgi:hypothetical protein
VSDWTKLDWVLLVLLVLLVILILNTIVVISLHLRTARNGELVTSQIKLLGIIGSSINNKLRAAKPDETN